jgi:hypothetical protein
MATNIVADMTRWFALARGRVEGPSGSIGVGLLIARGIVSATRSAHSGEFVDRCTYDSQAAKAVVADAFRRCSAPMLRVKVRIARPPRRDRFPAIGRKPQVRLNAFTGAISRVSTRWTSVVMPSRTLPTDPT